MDYITTVFLLKVVNFLTEASIFQAASSESKFKLKGHFEAVHTIPLAASFNDDNGNREP